MPKYKKKQLLDIVETLKKANTSIENAQKDKKDEIIEALGQCQQLAVHMGEEIETRGEAGEPIVAILEEYCENLYQISITLNDADQCRKLTKKIRKQLARVSNGIQFDLPEDKKEVVFLPYKASMWDSLESIWMAARDDDSVEVYVIPIPYFDKKPGGGFGEMHYEGDQYPDYVPITFYEEYLISERKPDIVYIHNPYDDWNYVTSIHPAFYARELKKYVEELVYVPYFILPEVEPCNQWAVDNIKHFVMNPGVIYSDKVIVQSEKMKQIYVNEYLKFAKENGLQGKHIDREFQEKRILGLGSPKIDKVLRTKKEDVEIPEEWLKIIQKPDGSWKKTVFYNTSVTTFLQNREKMLDKIEDVLRVFYEKREDITLLWRPHPLIQNTIKSMHPALWERYKQIEESYIEENWGIYDDTADMNRAIVLSDAYYGDWSSIVQLYEKTEKPIMIATV